MKSLIALLGLIFLLSSAFSVDRNNFKRCDQSSFCRRCRKVDPGASPYILLFETFKTYRTYVTVDVKNVNNNQDFELKLEAVKDDTFHVVINEKSPLHPRYVVEDALKGPLDFEPITVVEKSALHITVAHGVHKAKIMTLLQIDFFNQDKLVVSLNAKGLMRFEHLRLKP